LLSNLSGTSRASSAAPRIFPQHIGLPRGCLDAVLELLGHNDIRAEIQDERVAGCKVPVKFTGELRKDQKAAVRAMLKQEVGILCAPAA